MPVDVSNGTILTQIPAGVLKNAIETAGDMTQVQKSFIIKGTEFGVKLNPMPRSINITQKGYNCSKALLYGSEWFFQKLSLVLVEPLIMYRSRVLSVNSGIRIQMRWLTGSSICR